ncbi:alpha-galactosidase [Kiritimatiellaeota bacterium B1221]|nr:alpha-galactosidase [Kiritimatiellaeota bacterium B1221]
MSQQGAWYLQQLHWRGRPLCKTATSDLPAGWELNLDGIRHTPHLPGLIAAAPERRSATHLCFPHKNTNHRFELRLHFQLEAGALSQWLEVTNIHAAQPLILNRLQFAQYKFDPCFLEGSEIIPPRTGTPAPALENPFGVDDPIICFHRPQEHWGLALINLAPGPMHQIITGPYTSIGYDNRTVPFEWHLAPGETFTSDRAILLPYTGSVTAPLHSTLRKLLRKDRKLPLEWTYCSWEPFGREINHPKIKTQIDQAAQLGFETFVIDDGWQTFAGDWEADPAKFPHGLETIRDHATAQNLRLGLWLSPATVHTRAKRYPEAAQTLVRDALGNTRSTHVAEGILNLACLASDDIHLIQAKIDHWVSRLNLRYLKLDLPVAYDVYNQPAIHCHAKNHHHAPGADYSLKAYRAVQNLSRQLKRKHPGLIIDLTFEIWGGWHHIDPALIACADVCWLSNLSDAPGSGQYAPAAARNLAATRGRLVPPEHVVTGNLRCNGPFPLESAASALASYPVMLGDLSALPPETRSQLRQLFLWFKTLRGHYVLTEHQQSFLEVGQSLPSQSQGSGFLRCSEKGEGLLSVFRNLAPYPDFTFSIPLPDSIPGDQIYKLTPQSNPSPLIHTAADLRSGICVHLPFPHAFTLYAIEITASQT